MDLFVATYYYILCYNDIVIGYIVRFKLCQVPLIIFEWILPMYDSLGSNILYLIVSPQ